MREKPNVVSDPSAAVGYAVSAAFGTLGVIQLATEDLTGIGMLAIAAFSAWSAHISKHKRAECAAQIEKVRLDSEVRERALEARVKLIVAGVACDKEGCPVDEIARGRMGAMDCIKLPDAFPFDKLKTAKPSEDTVDLP